MDRHGRVFFIDHKNRITTWQKPDLAEEEIPGVGRDQSKPNNEEDVETNLESTGARTASPSQRERQQLDQVCGTQSSTEIRSKASNLSSDINTSTGHLPMQLDKLRPLNFRLLPPQLLLRGKEIS